MKPSFILLLTIAGQLVNLAPLVSQTLNLAPSMDNTIYSESDLSNGSGDYLFTGITGQGAERRALLKFDLSSIEPGDSVVSAELQLYMSKTIVEAMSVSLYMLSENWGEGASDADLQEGMGAAPSAGDATWNFAFYDSIQWDSPGGDFIAEASATTSVDQSGVYYSWTGDGLASDVRRWIANPTENFGWIVITAGNEVSAKRFNSRENSSNSPNLVLQLLTTSYEDNIISENFSIYPNPTAGIVHISGFFPGKIYQLIISDISGREIVHQEINVAGHQPIDVTIPDRGVYFIRIDSVFNGRVIVI